MCADALLPVAAQGQNATLHLCLCVCVCVSYLTWTPERHLQGYFTSGNGSFLSVQRSRLEVTKQVERHPAAGLNDLSLCSRHFALLGCETSDSHFDSFRVGRSEDA